MSAVGNAIKMTILLQSRGKMKICDIARELEISERRVRQYKDDLETAGIYINSSTGKYGGYELNSTCLLNANLILEDEAALLLANDYLKQNDFIYSKEIQCLADKIRTLLKSNEQKSVNYYVKRAKANCNILEQRNMIIKIYEAIITKRKILLEYFSLRSGLGERIIRPYAVYEYKGDSYIAAYCENRKEVLDFKILRIRKLTLLEEKFELPYDFSLKDTLNNCLGIYKDESVTLKLRIKKPMSYIVAEKIWVDNQKIEWLNDESIVFEAKMKGITEIKSWILGMGEYVEVIEPKSLKDEIIEEIKKLKNLYNF